MDRNFKVADIPQEKVSEIAEFQSKLQAETNRNIVLIAYEPTEK